MDLDASFQIQALPKIPSFEMLHTYSSHKSYENLEINWHAWTQISLHPVGQTELKFWAEEIASSLQLQHKSLNQKPYPESQSSSLSGVGQSRLEGAEEEVSRRILR